MTSCANPAHDHSHAAPPSHTAAPWGTSSLIGVFDLLSVWTERRRQRRALERLPEHLLSDIGISRLDAGHEAEKPFWKG